jgi:hypothetical protein
MNYTTVLNGMGKEFIFTIIYLSQSQLLNTESIKAVAFHKQNEQSINLEEDLIRQCNTL